MIRSVSVYLSCTANAACYTPFAEAEVAATAVVVIGLHVTQPAFPLRKFFRESLTHGPLNLWVNEKIVRVSDSPYFQF